MPFTGTCISWVLCSRFRILAGCDAISRAFSLFAKFRLVMLDSSAPTMRWFSSSDSCPGCLAPEANGIWLRRSHLRGRRGDLIGAKLSLTASHLRAANALIMTSHAIGTTACLHANAMRFDLATACLICLPAWSPRLFFDHSA